MYFFIIFFNFQTPMLQTQCSKPQCSKCYTFDWWNQRTTIFILFFLPKHQTHFTSILFLLTTFFPHSFSSLTLMQRFLSWTRNINFVFCTFFYSLYFDWKLFHIFILWISNTQMFNFKTLFFFMIHYIAVHNFDCLSLG